MKTFETSKVERIERFLDDVQYVFDCTNCGREVMVADYIMAEKCECGVDWKVKIIMLATGKKEN